MGLIKQGLNHCLGLKGQVMQVTWQGMQVTWQGDIAPLAGKGGRGK
jgi:hypothetical protein